MYGPASPSTFYVTANSYSLKGLGGNGSGFAGADAVCHANGGGVFAGIESELEMASVGQVLSNIQLGQVGIAFSRS